MSDAEVPLDEPGARSPIACFARNRIAGNLLMVLLLLGGVYTAVQLEIGSGV